MGTQANNQDDKSKSLCYFGSGCDLWNSDTALGRALREHFPGHVKSLTLEIIPDEPPTITVVYYSPADVLLCDDVLDIIKTFVPKKPSESVQKMKCVGE